MKVKPIAADSLGVRSMAMLVQTDDISVFIDPWAALGSYRYGLGPAAIEIQALRNAKARIENAAKKADAFILSHYHFDHHDPDVMFFEGKVVLAKDWKDNINKSQMQRAVKFRKQQGKSCEVRPADGQSFQFSNTAVHFSLPQPHGPEGIRLGYVIMSCIDADGQRFVHASDIQGPVSLRATKALLKWAPDILYMDGPPSYMLGYKFSRHHLEQAEKNLARIIKEVGCEVILDHHLLRDMKYKERLPNVYKTGKVKTAAEYMGKENKQLEARRKELY
jgi:predicted metallo-beta-lactamase superfamily hydrolase